MTFFPKSFPSLVLRKAPKATKCTIRELYTKEMVKARTRGDDISISVLGGDCE